MEVSKIAPTYKPSFKGLEAQPLQAIYVHGDDALGSEAIIKQLEAISRQHQVKIIKSDYTYPWVQDYVTFTPDGRVLTRNISIGRELAHKHNFIYDKIIDKKSGDLFHSPGGNTIFATNKKGKKVVISAIDYNHKCSTRGYERFYNVDKIIELPRADYHADLFITPIGDGKILVASDTLTLKTMVKMSERIKEHIENHPEDKNKYSRINTKLYKKIKEFLQSKVNYIENGSLDVAAKFLENEDFEVIRVPSIVYTSHEERNDKNLRLTYDLNFSNAITYKNQDGEVIYITGKSPLDSALGITPEISEKLGIGFEKMFIDSIAPHVKPQNVHFITGEKSRPICDILKEFKGGLHCMCLEVPKI